MLRSSILHKGQSVSIALVHGLFTHEGYWLPYLELLRKFRLVLIGVPYGDKRFDPFSAGDVLDGILGEEKVQVVVGHSLGASLVRVTRSDARKVLICDVGGAQRRRASPFETMTSLFGKISEEEKVLSMENAKKLYLVANKCQEDVDFVFTPTDDEYFNYSNEPNFSGTHFKIESAILQLTQLLSLEEPRPSGVSERSIV